MKGPIYREQNSINWRKNEELCFKAITEYRVNWARREHVDVRVLADWEHEVRIRVKQRILYFRKKHQMLRKQQVLKGNKHRKYINDFLEQYVLVPADKATNNIIVVCRKYYLEIILSELSIKDCSTLIAEHVVDLAKWNIAVASEMKQLPTLYWLPKLHKSPYGSRFIAASNICTTKPLSRHLTGCLSLVMRVL